MGHLALGLLTVILVAPTALAQTPSDGLPVEFEDNHTGERVVPLGPALQVPIPVAIGCDTMETAQTTTTASFRVGDVAPGVDSIVSPSSMEWVTEAETCTADPEGTPHEGTLELNVGFEQTVPAFSNVTLPVKMTVNKSPLAGEVRTYGPYQANVSVEAGYFNHYNVQADEKIKDFDADLTARYLVKISNHGNGETRFTFTPSTTESDLTITTQPSPLVLPAGEADNVTVSARLEGSGANLRSEVLAFQVQIDSASTQEPDAGNPQPAQAAFMAELEGAGSSPGDSLIAETPSPGLVVLMVSLIAASLLWKRTPS